MSRHARSSCALREEQRSKPRRSEQRGGSSSSSSVVHAARAIPADRLAELLRGRLADDAGVGGTDLGSGPSETETDAERADEHSDEHADEHARYRDVQRAAKAATAATVRCERPHACTTTRAYWLRDLRGLRGLPTPTDYPLAVTAPTPVPIDLRAHTA